MEFNLTTIGNGKPRIAIVGCVHGDEIMGKRIIKELKTLKIKKGSLTLILANEPAMKRKKRWIKQDLNRSFPGKENGKSEEKIAYHLKKELSKFDLVIDLHATNSNFRSLAIITKFSNKHRQLLKLVPIKRVALIKKKVFGGNEMISHVKLGIALEYGPDKTGRNFKTGLRDVKSILKNLGVISGKKIAYKNKDLYRVFGSYSVPKEFKQLKSLGDFKIIKKGQVIGHEGKKEIRSEMDFYPLFLGKGRYAKTLALTSVWSKLLLN
ncbi:MAG: succinylglutamate desuccinylase/aspartoacylase family protein [Candidatus Buchananbacteria bacterium]